MRDINILAAAKSSSRLRLGTFARIAPSPLIDLANNLENEKKSDGRPQVMQGPAAAAKGHQFAGATAGPGWLRKLQLFSIRACLAETKLLKLSPGNVSVFFALTSIKKWGNMKLLIGLAGLLSFVLSGCSVPQYHQAPAGTPSATLIFPDHKNTTNQSLEFHGYTRANCEPAAEDGQLAFFNVLRSAPKPVKLLADQRIYIRQAYVISGVGTNYASYVSMASFVPETNKSYRIDPGIAVFQDQGVVPRYTSAICQMKIIDVETGKLTHTDEVPPVCLQQKR